MAKAWFLVLLFAICFNSGDIIPLIHFFPLMPFMDKIYHNRSHVWFIIEWMVLKFNIFFYTCWMKAQQKNAMQPQEISTQSNGGLEVGHFNFLHCILTCSFRSMSFTYFKETSCLLILTSRALFEITLTLIL